VAVTVWVDDWQMQCCGDPFRVGSHVSWSVLDADQQWLSEMLGPAAAEVTVAEEHHASFDGLRTLEGTVTSIRAAHCRYAPEPGKDTRFLAPVPGSGTLIDIDSADGWTLSHDDLRFTGYVVTVAIE
jgi:hypothetical protein